MAALVSKLLSKEAQTIRASRPRRRRSILKKHPVSCLTYDATEQGGRRTVTSKEIRAALAGFP
jgi:hypothetical protein